MNISGVKPWGKMPKADLIAKCKMKAFFAMNVIKLMHKERY